jgi:hypothetical protein
MMILFFRNPQKCVSDIDSVLELLYCLDVGNIGNILGDAISIVRVKDRGRM